MRSICHQEIGGGGFARWTGGVRGHAAWALGRIASALPAADATRAEAAEALARAAEGDGDARVREEARLALAEASG